MGLDLVELVIAIEQHFEIQIPNADAARLWTTGHVIDYLVPRLSGQRIGRRDVTTPCPTQQAFYRVRRALCATIGTPVSDITPE